MHLGNFGRAISLVSIVLACAFYINGALHQYQFRTDDPKALETYRQAVATLRELPTSATLLGYGWYSAPALALYSNRKISNIDTIPMDQLASDGKAYLVLDKAAISDKESPFPDYLRRFDHHVLVNGPNAQIFQIDFGAPVDWARDWRDDPASLRSDLDFSGGVNYKPLVGVYSDAWATTRAELLLASDAAMTGVELSIYTPDLPRLSIRSNTPHRSLS